MIYRDLSIAEADAITSPKYIVLEDNFATVYTDVDMPPPTRYYIRIPAIKLFRGLNQLGLRDLIQQAIDTSGNQALIDEWNKNTEFDSDHPLIISVGALPSVGKSPAEITAIFAFCSTL